jgi:hypothetical protein
MNQLALREENPGAHLVRASTVGGNDGFDGGLRELLVFALLALLFGGRGRRRGLHNHSFLLFLFACNKTE